MFDSATPWTAAHQASLSITNFRSLLKLMSIESVMPSKHLILCCPLLLQPSVFPSIRIFSNESVPRSRWPKYWSSNFSISPSNEYSGLIYLGWLGGSPCCPETLKHLLQHHYTVHGLLQARILEWIAFPSSRGSFKPRSPSLQAHSLEDSNSQQVKCDTTESSNWIWVLTSL